MFKLFDELKNYKPYDIKEQEDVIKITSFLKNNTNCCDRSNLDGYITAGAFVCDYGMIRMIKKYKGFINNGK